MGENSLVRCITGHIYMDSLIKRNTLPQGKLGCHNDPREFFLTRSKTYTQHLAFREAMHAVQEKYVRMSKGHHGDPEYIAKGLSIHPNGSLLEYVHWRFQAIHQSPQV